MPLALPRLCQAVALAAALAGCAPAGGEPSLDPIANQTAFVGVEFSLELRASDPDRDELFYTFDSNIPDLARRAQIRPFGDGANAQFVWTPRASDVGLWAIDIRVTDGEHDTVETVNLEVKASEGVGAPVFRKPLGTGSTLDLGVKDCIDVEVVVEDADSTSLTIAQGEPRIEGATLEQTDGFTALWSWCPSKTQVEAMDRYSLVLTADDGQNPATVKNFLVVLRKPPLEGCAGEAPNIAHTAEDQSTQLSLTIDARITDDLGLKGEPLVYTSTTPPASPPDLGAMVQASMLLVDGDGRDGTWAAEVANPVASAPAGTSATLYYLIVASDNDDGGGDCDHTSQSTVFAITVTNPGGQGGLGLCEACTADSQCGDADDHCVVIGNQNASFCAASCSGDADCAADSHCSSAALTSVDGASARQCVPDDNTCVEVAPPMCQDDGFEDNDSRTVAAGKPALPTGSHALVSCPNGPVDDEDWFAITIGEDSTVTLTLAGGDATDLDLALVDANGSTLQRSDSTSSNESIVRCLTPGTYFVRAHAIGQAENAYTLTYARSAGSCASTCSDDANEPDDGATAATAVNLDETFYTHEGQVCSGDEDWYAVQLFAGEELHVTLAFTQTDDASDLDLQLFRGSTNLFPCVEANDTDCSPANGSSSDSNENLVKPITVAGTYYVVVRGWDGSAAPYDLCVGLSAGECAPLP